MNTNTRFALLLAIIFSITLSISLSTVAAELDQYKVTDWRQITGPNDPSITNQAIYEDIIVYSDKRASSNPSIPTTSNIYMYNLSTHTETQISSAGVSNKDSAVIYGNYVVWRDEEGGIYRYDLETQTEAQITEAAFTYSNENVDIDLGFHYLDIFDMDIYGNYVVWTDTRNFHDLDNLYERPRNYDIYMYDMESEREVQVTTNTGDQIHPAIFGELIIYTNRTYFPLEEEYSNIWCYNISDGTHTRLTSGTVGDGAPLYADIYEDLIVFSRFKDTDFAEVCLYNLTSKTEYQLSPQYSHDPADWHRSKSQVIHEDLVIWHSYRWEYSDPHRTYEENGYYIRDLRFQEPLFVDLSFEWEFQYGYPGIAITYNEGKYCVAAEHDESLWYAEVSYPSKWEIIQDSIYSVAVPTAGFIVAIIPVITVIPIWWLCKRYPDLFPPHVCERPPFPLLLLIFIGTSAMLFALSLMTFPPTNNFLLSFISGLIYGMGLISGYLGLILRFNSAMFNFLRRPEKERERAR